MVVKIMRVNTYRVHSVVMYIKVYIQVFSIYTYMYTDTIIILLNYS